MSSSIAFRVMEPGTRLSHYEIVRLLGAGGMGEVYVAHDLALDRQVALKVLPAELAADPDRRARFIREAKAVAALNHPSIVVIYSVEEEGERVFLTMELVEGAPLSARLGGEPVSLSALFEVAIPLADAISAAHQSGIAHRDLKPDNIMITPEGRVKVLDFGLAKLIGGDAEPELAAAPTAMLTEEGAIVGTVAYMSPEQAQGMEVDARTDIFSLGIILYEMAAGRRPFEGVSKISILSALIKDSPTPVVDANRSMPRHLGRIVKHCLEKEPDRRYQSALDVRNELESLREEVRSGEVDAPSGEQVPPLAGSPPARTSTAGADGNGSTPLAPPSSVEDPVVSQSGSPRGLGATQSPPVRSARWRTWGATAAFLSLVVSASWWGLGGRSTNGPGQVPAQTAGADMRPSVAVVPFENTTGAEDLEWLREGIAEMLVTDLSQVAGLRVLGGERVRDVLAEFAGSDAELGSLEAIRALAASAGTTTVIAGSFLQAGELLRVSVRILDSATGEVVDGKSVDGTGQESLFASTDTLSRWIRATLATPDNPEVTAIDRDLADVTTRSVDAFRFYAEGVKRQHRSEYAEAVGFFEEAVRLDPEFALAYVKLSICYGNLRQTEDRDRYAERALEYSDRLSERERHYLEGAYHSRNPETARRSIAAYSKAVELYPDDHASRNNLAMQLSGIHLHAEASAQLEEALRRGTTFGGARTNLVYNYLREGRPEDAEDFARDYLLAEPGSGTAENAWAEVLLATNRLDEASRFLKDEGGNLALTIGLRLRMRLEVLLEDWEELSRIVSSIPADVPGGPGLAAHFGSRGALYQGRVDDATTILDSAAETLSRGQGMQIEAAQLALVRGDAQAAIEKALAARSEAPSLSLELFATAVAARARAALGRETAVSALLEEHAAMTARIGTPHYQRDHFLLRGQLALAAGDAETALADLMAARELLEAPMGYWAPGPHAQVGFAIGRAHLLQGNLPAAEQAFEKVTQLRQPRIGTPVSFVRSFYFLGHVRDQLDDGAGAREAYESFLRYWADGDIDRERVTEASAYVSS